MPRNIACLVAIAVLSAIAAGCGQKGPLHLPGNGDPQQYEQS